MSRSRHTCSPCTTSSRSPSAGPTRICFSSPSAIATYGVPSEEDEFWGLKFYRAAGLRLRTLVARGVERFLYVYDFGDDWRHDIVIERVSEGEPHIDYPVFVDGKRRGPPEDVGGVGGFMEFLEAVRDPMHREHREMIRWYSKPFDPLDIDERRIRMALLSLARRRRALISGSRS